MQCKFCNTEMKTTRVGYRESTWCNNHKPASVHYKLSTKNIDKWFIYFNSYRLMYSDGKTYFQKLNPESDSPSEVVIQIRKFDHELKINPEDFSKKLPILLTFL